MADDKFIQTFFREDKFEQRITFPRKVKSKSNKNKEVKMKLDITKIIIIIALYLGYFVYLYVLFNHWQLASAGNTLIGIIQTVIPLSAIIFINLILIKKINISIPM